MNCFLKDEQYFQGQMAWGYWQKAIPLASSTSPKPNCPLRAHQSCICFLWAFISPVYLPFFLSFHPFLSLQMSTTALPSPPITFFLFYLSFNLKSNEKNL